MQRARAKDSCPNCRQTIRTHAFLHNRTGVTPLISRKGPPRLASGLAASAPPPPFESDRRSSTLGVPYSLPLTPNNAQSSFVIPASLGRGGPVAYIDLRIDVLPTLLPDDRAASITGDVILTNYAPLGSSADIRQVVEDVVSSPGTDMACIISSAILEANSWLDS